MLSDIAEVPYITFMIKGVINSGKSTLFNAIFSRNISKTSMKRQTMCNVILSEDPYYKNQEELKANIESVNQRVYELSEKSNAAIQKIEEIYWTVPLVENFFKRINGVRYRFVESVGFDDPKTDIANKRWFKENTKWADVLLFVTDKEKCMNTKSEQDLFRDTVNDIKDCLVIGKKIFLIVVINKVEDDQDEEVIAMIEQCSNNVSRIINESNASDIKYFVSVISAMNCLYYRLFMKNYSFDDMEPKDIARLAEIELGRRGRDFVKNPSDRARLAEIIKSNLSNNVTKSKWQKDCGINEMIESVNNHVLSEDNILQIFNWQYNTIMNDFENSLKTNNLTWKSGFEIMKNYIQYHRSTLLGLDRRIKLTFLPRIINKCMTVNGIKDLKYTIDCLNEIKSFDETSVKLLTSEEWSNIISLNIQEGVRSLWYGKFLVNNKKFINFPINNKSSSISNSNVKAKHYSDYIELTFGLLLYKSTYSVTKLLSDIIIPIIIELRTSEEELYYNVLESLEDKIYPVVSTFDNSDLKQELCLEILITKINYRNYIPGYGLLLKELANSNNIFREKCFFALVPVLYEVSDFDREWALNMRNEKKSYREVLKNYQYFKCEKFLL